VPLERPERRGNKGIQARKVWPALLVHKGWRATQEQLVSKARKVWSALLVQLARKDYKGHKVCQVRTELMEQSARRATSARKASKVWKATPERLVP
jgi:hypothetical protein